jgi:hypothetical protein
MTYLTPRLAAFSLVAAPALTLAAHLTQASPAAHDTASELTSIAAHAGRYQVAGLIGFLSMLIYVPALIALARPLRLSRRRAGFVGLTMSMTGLLALVSLMGSGPVSLALARADQRTAMVAVTDAYESSMLFGVWGMLMVLGFALGPVVLGVALWRSGTTSWAVPAFLVAGVVLQAADAGRWPLAAGFACTLAGLGLVALHEVRTPAATTHQAAAEVPVGKVRGAQAGRSSE